MLPPVETVSSKTSVPWWGRIETLWLSSPALCAFLYTLCLPLAPNDFWYHLRAGWWAMEHHALPTSNLFSWGVPTTAPYFYQSWISERILAVATGQGLAWAFLLRAACVTAAIGLVTAATRAKAIQAGLSPAGAARLAALGGTLSLLIASNNLDLRPQTFSMLLFGLWLLVLGARRRGTPSQPHSLAWGCPLIMVLWANTHGAFAVGVVYIAALAVGDAATRRNATLAIISVLCVLALFLNPRGSGIFPYLAQFSDKSISQLYIEEWQSPKLNEWHSALFLLSPIPLLAVAVLGKLRRGREFFCAVSAGEWLGGALLFYLGLREVRAMIWFGLWLPVALAGVLAALRNECKDTVRTPLPPRPVQFANAVLLSGLWLATIPLLPWFKPSLPWPPEFAKRFAPTPQSGAWGFPHDPELILEDSTPVAAAEFLRKSPPKGRLWNEMVYGSYLTWALYPDTKPACDPRIELFPDQFWREYFQICAGGKEVPELLEKRDVTDLLLDAKQQSALVARLRSLPDWKQVFTAGEARIYRHQTS